MKSYPGMKIMQAMLPAIALLAAACVEHSVASRAAAYRDGHDHGAASTTGAIDRSAHGGATHDQHAGMQHTAPSAAADPHAQHRAQPSTAQMDNSQHLATSTAAAGANAHAHGAPAPVPAAAPAPRSSAGMQRLQPATTLRRDAFDAPASLSVSEAAKAAQGGGHDGHSTRGITAGEDHENPPTPMPATRDGSNRAPAVDHSQHSATSQPAAATVYTCPMHPEVTSDKPGTCPKCGMALVKKNN
jgi:Heavy metal binding domain